MTKVGAKLLVCLRNPTYFRSFIDGSSKSYVSPFDATFFSTCISAWDLVYNIGNLNCDEFANGLLAIEKTLLRPPAINP